MKRLVVLIILVLISISLFAEGYYWSSSTTSTGKNSSMTVVVEGTSNILSCGISSTFDSTASGWGLTDVTKKEFDITAVTSGQEWSYTGSISELYVWWQIYSTTSSYNVQLSLSPLTDKTTNKINIPYSAVIKSLNSSGQYVVEDNTTFNNISSSMKSKVLYIYEGSSSSGVVSGHRMLSFQTVDAKGKEVADSFEATLTITVSTI